LSAGVVAVLGMHRSGTSWLAGSLQELGLEMGEVSTSDPHNKKGNRESPVLMEIHEGVLADSGGSWKRPPAKVSWSSARREALAAHVRDMGARYPRGWGFKDPRALLVLDEWKRQVPELVRVGIFRHPLAVWRSLHARSERFDRDRAFSLWCAYNERLVAEHRRSAFPVLRFDVGADELFAGLSRIAKALGLPGADRKSRFFDAELVHNDEASEPVPRPCRELWNHLEAQVVRA
jgi:hypothetical protein